MSNQYPFHQPPVPPQDSQGQPSYGVPSSRRGFFDALRYSGFVRSEPRLIGGVLAGLSLKWGIDRTLLRVIFVIAAFAFPVLACAYALAWAFLPEERDGRIHAQSLIVGHFDIAQLGALALFTLGAGNSATYLHVFVGAGLFSLFLPLLLVAGVVAIIALLVTGGTQQRNHPAPTFPSPHGTPVQGFSSPVNGGSAPAPTAAPAAAFASDVPPVVPFPAEAPAFTADAPPSVPAPAEAPAGSPVPPASLPDSAPSVPASDAFAHTPTASTAAFAPALPVPPYPQTPQAQGFPPSQPQSYSQPQRYPQTPAMTNPEYASTYSQPLGAGLPPQSFVAPRPIPPIRHIPVWVNFLITGLLALVFAGVLYVSIYDGISEFTPQIVLVGGGVSLLLVAIPLAIAAIKDRSAYWLMTLSIVGALLAFPVTAGAIAAIQYASSHDEYVQELNYASSAETDLGDVWDTEWDLTDLPAGDTQYFNANNVTGHLTLRVRKDQPIEVRVRSLAGSMVRYHYDTGTQHMEDFAFGLQTDVRYRSVTTTEPVTVVEIANVLGELEILEVDMPEPEPLVPSPAPADSSSQSDSDSDSPQSLSAERSQSGVSQSGR